tara:strand:+ start:200 stop:334 length:135 start_codon:yes stop_codon:yes gene_type:complete
MPSDWLFVDIFGFAGLVITAKKLDEIADTSIPAIKPRVKDRVEQ